MSEMPLAPDATAPATARAFVSDLAGALPRDLVRRAALLTSEVVTNAVRHGEPDITIRVVLEESALRVSVHDDGSGASVLAGRPDLHALGGRGLPIIAALATSWGVSSGDTPRGKDVWFTIDHSPGASS